MAKPKQFELFTTRSEPNGMPYQVRAGTRAEALRFVRGKLLKGERIISLRQIRRY